MTFHSSDVIYQLTSENSQTGYIGQAINSQDIRTKIKTCTQIKNIEINIIWDHGMDNNKNKLFLHEKYKQLQSHKDDKFKNCSSLIENDHPDGRYA